MIEIKLINIYLAVMLDKKNFQFLELTLSDFFSFVRSLSLSFKISKKLYLFI